MMAGDRALCWLLLCPAVATTTVMSVTWKLGSVWATKELLSQIQKRFQKPQEKLEALKEAASGLLSKHSEELQAAEELLRETETKTQESNGLLLLIKANLREFDSQIVEMSKSVLNQANSFKERSPRSNKLPMSLLPSSTVRSVASMQILAPCHLVSVA